MKRILSALLIGVLLFCGGCGAKVKFTEDGVEIAAQASQQNTTQASRQSSQQNSKQQSNTKKKKQSQASKQPTTAPATTQAPADTKKSSYTMADIRQLKNTDNCAKKTLEHIFDGTINSQGKATGYHYTQVTDSKGEVIKGTESKPDKHGVFTAKVKVSGVKKNGFSSFYPESWTPQQVINAINEAYQDALSDHSNPHGSLWIGYSGDLEINMYLDSNKKITTAYPIYEGD